MRVLPCPVAGTFAGLLKLSCLVPANIDQLNIAVVNLRRLAQDLQYAACAGACLRDGRKLLRDLRDGRREALVQGEERDERAQRDGTRGHGDERPNDGAEHVAHVSEAHDHGHQDVGEAVCLHCGVA